MMQDKIYTWKDLLFKAVIFSALLSVCLGVDSVYALTLPTLDQVIINISKNLQNVMRLATALAYVFGVFFIISGLLDLKHVGEQRTMMSQEHGIKKPLIFIFVGTLLIYLPSSINAGLNTIFATPVPYSYQIDAGNPWSQLLSACFVILQLIGVIAFIRGLIILTALGGHGGQQGTFARGMMHIIGGILCINMYDTVQVILNTMGITNVFQ